MSQINFKIRCSAISKITAGRIGLTEIQEQKMRDLITRRNEGLKPLTANMEAELKQLQDKHLNPELPEGAKTYCEEYLGLVVDGRQKQVKSKYIEKGLTVEEDAFTLMCVELGLGMLYKNTERKDNGWLIGECDLDHAEKDTVYDNKSSWEYGNFPMWKSENQNKQYEDQLQGYMELWNRSNAILCYTLIDCPENLLQYELKPWLSDDQKQDIAKEIIFTKEYWDAMKSKYFNSASDIDFKPIPDNRRVKCFEFKRDPKFIADLKIRHKLCQEYINYLFSNKK